MFLPIWIQPLFATIPAAKIFLFAFFDKFEINDLKIVKFLVFSDKLSAQLISYCSPHFSESFYYVSSH